MVKIISSLEKNPILRSILVSILVLLLVGIAAFLYPKEESSYASAVPVVVSPIPSQLQVPKNEQLVLSTVVQQGVQVYRCSPQGSWVLQGPLAILMSPRGQRIVLTFGPRWQAPDTSAIVGSSIAAASHQPNFPWLLYRVTAHSGRPGLFSRVNYVQLLYTHGGGLSTHCTVVQNPGLKSVPYTATYQFWQPKP
jgi:hypothetical protein